jgi:hypothetical protein
MSAFGREASFDGRLWIVTALLAAAPVASAFGQDSAGWASAFELSMPVTALPDAEDGAATGANRPRINPLAGESDAGRRATWTRGAAPRDPLLQRSRGPMSRTPGFSLRFNGSSNPKACGGCTPPDTIGDVGPSHFIQVVNATKVAIFNKSGILLKKAFNLGSLWSGGACRHNFGDPNVRYDPIADRWLLAQFNAPNGDATPPFYLCFAISKTPDPLGAYYLYAFSTPEFPDYFKVGVWPTGYYVSTNETTYTAYAFDRSKMLAGDASAGFVRHGTRFPTGGGLFYTFKDNAFHGGHDRIELFQLTPDFTAQTLTFNLLKSIRIAAFTYTPCGFFHLNCVPQKGTNQKVDAIGEWPMQRLAYRKFAKHAALVGNFTVGGGTANPGAAIRWFELRDTGGTWSLYQEGTLDLNDGQNRFMGSIAMDKEGNIALGYSVSSSTLFPSIRYVTRAPGDPLGAMGAEVTLRDGQGAQTASNRWGDYSAMSVDPATDCQFWYTNEYYSTDSAVDWKTEVGAFTVPGCR